MSIGRRGGIDGGLFLAVAGLLAWQLFFPPALSIANNGDFAKLAGRACLEPVAADGAPPVFDYTVLGWRFSPAACYRTAHRTTAEAALRVAVALNRIFHSPADFDLRWMGAVYCLIFLAGFATLQRALRAAALPVSIAVQCLWILVTCNATYVPWFNTFYFDALSLATLTGALASVGVAVLQARVSSRDLLIASGWLAVLAGSKAQHSLPALALGAAIWIRAGRTVFPPLPFRLAGSALVVLGAGFSLSGVPRADRAQETFSALFYRILPAAKDPAALLSKTRIPIAWAQYNGLEAFSPGSPLADPAAAARFADWFRPIDLIRLYAEHPSAAWTMTGMNLIDGSLDRVLRVKTGLIDYRLSNYDRSAGKPPRTLSQFFAWWSLAKHALIADRPYVYLAYILVAVALAWVLAPPLERLPMLLTLTTLALAMEWAVSLLDGLDANRHLTVFNYLLDLFVCADILFAAWNRIAPADNVTAPVTIPHCADIRQ